MPGRTTWTSSGAGDVLARSRWTTPTDGPLATPEAWLAVAVDHDVVVDSYGVELTINNLATSPPLPALEPSS